MSSSDDEPLPDSAQTGYNIDMDSDGEDEDDDEF